MQFVLTLGSGGGSSNAGPQEILAMNTELRFFVDTTNPAQVHSALGNNWLAYHKRKIGEYFDIEGTRIPVYTSRSTHAFKSWMVLPQLSEVSLTISGNFRAAEAYTDLTISFKPVQNSVTLWAEALQPPGFRFEAASIAPPYVVDSFSKANILIVNSIGAQADVPLVFTVNNIKLGLVGGQTVWDLKTYSTELVNGRMQSQFDFRDEQLAFKGFILPGKLGISSDPPKLLITDYMQSPSVYPTDSLFPARELEMSTADLSFTLTQPVGNGGFIVVSNEGLAPYVLSKDAVYIAQEGVPLTVKAQFQKIASDQGGVPYDLEWRLVISLNEGVDAGPDAYALLPGKAIKLRFRCTPRVGNSFWRLETFSDISEAWLSPGGPVLPTPPESTRQAMGLPSNTNDAVEGPFAPVFRLGVKITVLQDRRPPAALIDLSLQINPGGASVRRVIIIAPPTFTFPTLCGDKCEPYKTIGSERRKSVKIEDPLGYSLTAGSLNDVKIKVNTPEVNPLVMTWFVQTESGSTVGGWITTGWENDAGFGVRKMSQTRLWYAPRKGLQGAMLAFSFNVIVPGGSIIKVLPPVLYEVYCSLMPGSKEPALKQISLPGDEPPQCQDSPMRLTLKEPLPAGRYSFIIGGDIPVQLPATGLAQFFSISILKLIAPEVTAAPTGGAAAAGGLSSAGIVVDANSPDGGGATSQAEQAQLASMSRPQEKVLEADYELPALTPLQSLMACCASLGWDADIVPFSDSDWDDNKEYTVNVHVGVTFEEDVRGVNAILITLPDPIKHVVKDPSMVKNLNKNFPVSHAGTWVGFSDPGLMVIYVDESQSKLPHCAEADTLLSQTLICAGTYKWAFSVKVPERTPPPCETTPPPGMPGHGVEVICDTERHDIPRENIWYLSVCFDRSCKDILQDGSDAIPLTFPLPGFQLGDVATAFIPSGAVRSTGGLAGLWTAVVVGFLSGIWAMA